MRTSRMRQDFVLVGVVALATIAGVSACGPADEKTRSSGLVSGIGHLEASEIPVATNLPGRVDRILVDEGESVRAGQVVAQLQVPSLVAERTEAYAHHRHALFAAASAEADVLLRQSQAAAAEVVARQYESQFQLIAERLSSAVTMLAASGTSGRAIEELRAEARHAAAAAASADAQLAAARVAVAAARLHVEGAHAAVGAAEATIRRIETTLAEATLKSPRDADVHSRLAEPGDVLQPGNGVLNLVDTGNLHLAFTVPAGTVDAVRVGDEARIVLDSMPQSVFRAIIASVDHIAPASVRQDTANERQRPMCRLTARLDRALTHHRVKQLKVGMSGVAWLRLDPAEPWPPTLNVLEP
jgi:HlyD family secretion protein